MQLQYLITSLQPPFIYVSPGDSTAHVDGPGLVSSQTGASKIINEV